MALAASVGTCGGVRGSSTVWKTPKENVREFHSRNPMSGEVGLSVIVSCIEARNVSNDNPCAVRRGLRRSLVNTPNLVKAPRCLRSS